MTLNTFLGQPCCICIKEDNFHLKGSETDVTGINGVEMLVYPYTLSDILSY